MAIDKVDSTVNTQTNTANQAAANQNIKSGGKEVLDGSEKVAKGIAAKTKDVFAGTGRNITWAVKDAKYSPVQLAKAAPGRAKVEFNNITTPRNLATHRGMLGSLAGAALCATAAYGMIVFDKTVEVLFGLLLHDLLIYAAVAAGIWFVAQALIRLFRVTDPVAATSTEETGTPSVAQADAASKAQAEAGVDVTPAKEPSKSEVEARTEKAKAAYEAKVAKKTALEQKKADVKTIDEDLTAVDKELDEAAAEYGYHLKFSKEFNTVTGTVDAQARIAELEAALAKAGKKTEEAAKAEADVKATVDGALSGANTSTAGVKVTETETTTKEKTVEPLAQNDDGKKADDSKEAKKAS